jgi:predicted nucleotidyltransferase
MARGNAREYLFNDKVRLKKYFYVLRPLLAIRFVEQGKGIPPVRFEDLVEAVAPDEIRASIAVLLALKRNTEELGLGDPIPEIGEFIESELERHGTLFTGHGRPDLLDNSQIRSELNTVFRDAISEAGSGAV